MIATPDSVKLHDLQQRLEAAHEKVLALTRDLDSDPDRDLDAGLALALALAIGRARGLRFRRTRGLSRGLAHAHGLALALNRALNWGLTLDLVRDRGVALDLARSFARDVDGALSGVLTEVRRLQPVPAPGAADTPVPDRVRQAVVRVVGWSVRILPAQERLRYHEEFMSELYELRTRPRRAQVEYAVRVLVYAVVLRCALRDDTER